MFGANSTAVWWAAASISAFWVAVCPVVATTSGICRATHTGSIAIVPSGAEKSMTQSRLCASGRSEVTGTPMLADPSDLARVAALRGAGRRIDGGDDLQLRVFLRQRRPAAGPSARRRR